MNIKKILIVGASFAFTLVFAPNASFAQMDNESFLRARIAELQTQLDSLTAQLKGKAASGEFCHTFKVNLRIGQKGVEVAALQTVLEKEGFMIAKDEKSGGGRRNIFAEFGESTASAVTGFQEKYRDEILTPNGLERGNGFVGRSTRAKLNELYGCGRTREPSVKLISPNGGEKWEIGKAYEMQWRVGTKWKASYRQVVDLMKDGALRHRIHVFEAGDAATSFTWIVPPSIGEAPAQSDNLRVRVSLRDTARPIPGDYSGLGEIIAADESDSPFSIVAAGSSGPAPSVTVVNPAMGVIGTRITLTGYGFGVHDTVVWLKRSFWTGTNLASEKAVLWGGMPSSDSTITATIVSRLCRQYTGASGPPCSSWMDVTPGVYEIYVENQNGSSRSVRFTVTLGSVDSSLIVLSPNGGERLATGSKFTIRWQSSLPTDTPVDIILEAVTTDNSYLGAGTIVTVKAGDRQYEWTVSDRTPDFGFGSLHKLSHLARFGRFIGSLLGNVVRAADSGGGDSAIRKFAIRIGPVGSAASPSNLYDKSDAPFTIVPAVAQPSLTVLSPNGGEQWQLGSTQIIRWTRTGTYPDGTRQAIFLLKGGRVIYNPYTSNVNSSEISYTWMLPVNTNNPDLNSGGSDYKIRVESYNQNTGQVIAADESDSPFTISAPASAARPFLSSLAPSYGWIDSRITAYGTGLAAPGTIVKFASSKGSGYISNLSILTKADGVLEFIVPTSLLPCPATVAPCSGQNVRLVPGTTYTVSVVNQNGESNTLPFGLQRGTPPSVEVHLPNGGETWIRGTTQTIYWFGAGYATHLLELLSSDNARVYSIGRAVLVGRTSGGPAETFQWNVGQAADGSVIPDGQYRLRISGLDSNGARIWYDESDEAFSVLTANQSTRWVRADPAFTGGTAPLGSANAEAARFILAAGESDAVVQNITVRMPADINLSGYTQGGCPFKTFRLVLPDTGTAGPAANVVTSWGIIYDPASAFEIPSWCSATLAFTSTLRIPAFSSRTISVRGETQTFTGLVGKEYAFEVQRISSESGGVPWAGLPARSAPFTITSASPYAVNPSGEVVSIAVTSPFGGETWQMGGLYTISWVSQNASADMWVSRVKLYKGSQFLLDIIPAGSNYLSTGSLQWRIPTNLAAGNDFSIQITLSAPSGSGSRNVATGVSGYFSVVR